MTLETQDDAPDEIEAVPTSSTIQRFTIGTLSYTKRQLIVLFCWLLWGDFAWSMKERAVGPIAQLVIKRYHASDILMSIFMVALPAAIGMILGPAISFRSDRHRSSWGRRMPYIALTTPFAVLATCGLGMAPYLGRILEAIPGFHSIPKHELVLFSFGLFWSLFEIASIAANAVFGALINDVVPHEFLGRFYGCFRALSLIAGIVFNYKLIGLADRHTTAMFLGVGIFYGIGFLLMCLNVKEGDYPPPDDYVEGSRVSVLVQAKIYATECLSNPYYRWVFLATIIAGLAFMPINLYSLPYSQTLHMSLKAYGKCLAITYTISLCLAYLLGVLADSFHPLRTGIYAMFVYGITSLLGGLLITGQPMFTIFFVIHGVMSGTYFTLTASLGQRLFPRLRYAQFASAAGLGASIANMIAGPASGALLDAVGHLYRYSFLMAAVLAFAAGVLLVIVNRQFIALGGQDHYVAPE